MTGIPMQVGIAGAFDGNGLDAAAVIVREGAGEPPARLGFAVHDASRLEWSLSLPLPTAASLDYSLSVELRVPSNLFARNPLWEQLQTFTRLDGPEVDSCANTATVDALRRGALGAVYRLAQSGEGFRRQCEAVLTRIREPTTWRALEGSMSAWLDVAASVSSEARETLCAERADDACAVARERELVDEYLSVRIVDGFAASGRALERVAAAVAPDSHRELEALRRLEARLAQALSSEIDYRIRRGFTRAGGASPEALVQHVERASALKKHFQQLLFLERDSFQVDDRAYHWIAALVAVVASTWAFAWQLALTNPASRTSQLGSGLVTLSLLAGLVYAAKDRIKDVGRSWITRTFHRVWRVQRVTRYRMRSAGSPARQVVVSARESFDHNPRFEPDPLNPESGATQSVVVVAYEHTGKVLPHAELFDLGVQRVKHVFRYDLSPMFARLDDAAKPVPILDAGRDVVHFVDVPRYYRLPMVFRVRCGNQRLEECATLVLDKRGLDRLERPGLPCASLPSCSTGVAP